MNISRESQDAITELEVQRRVKQMRDDELVDFIRDTVTHLEVLARRLEVLADDSQLEQGEQGNAGSSDQAGSS